MQNYPFQVTQRTYEILGSGGFLLTTDTPAVSTLFKPGHDLVVSASSAENLAKVKFYLDRMNVNGSGSRDNAPSGNILTGCGPNI